MTTEIEYIAYHRVKRIFIPIMDIESENPEDIEVYEFEGQNFRLVAK
jgi:ribosomal protein L20A (L18A)